MQAYLFIVAIAGQAWSVEFGGVFNLPGSSHAPSLPDLPTSGLPRVAVASRQIRLQLNPRPPTLDVSPLTLILLPQFTNQTQYLL